jgi:hypothetical protein
MPTAGRDAHVVLSHADGSSNVVNLTLWKDSPDLPGGWQSDFVSPATPRQAQDDANYQQQSPDDGLVYDESTFHRGFGQGRVVIGTKEGLGGHRYGYSDGVLAMFRDEIGLGYQEDEVDAFVRNGRFETGSTSSWTTSNVTLAIHTADTNTGTYAAQATASANNGTISDVYQGTVSVLRSREVTLYAYIKRASGSGSIRAQIVDSAGTTSGSTSSATTWTLIEVTRTIDSGATSINWRLDLSTSGDVFLIDDIFIVPTGGVNFPVPPQEFAANIYIPCGRFILQWNEANDTWYPVYADSSNVITSLLAYSTGTTNRLIAGRGTSDNYLISTNGTTWSDPTTPTGNVSQAALLARVRNANGDWALLKSRLNQVALTIDPSDTANWGADIQVGDHERGINNLISANDTVYIGREDGLFVYDRSVNQFRDIEPDANFFPNVDNFKAGIGRGGSVWAGGGGQAFWRITPTGLTSVHHQWEPMAHLFEAPAYQGFGGRVTAVSQDRANLWVAVSDDLGSIRTGFPHTFPFRFATAGQANAVYIMTVRQQRDDAASPVETVPHTVSSFAVSGVRQLGRSSDTTRGSLFIFGYSLNTDIDATDNEEPRVIRLRLPLDNENPRQNSTIEVRRAGNIYLPFVDFNFPDVEKAQAKLGIGSRNFSSGEKYVTVHYKLDDATADDTQGWTPWGDDGIFDVSPEEIKAAVLTTPVTFRRLRLRLQFTSDSNSEPPPVVVAVVMHIIWNPLDFRVWRGVVKFADRRSLQLRRVRQTVLRSADISNLNTLRQQPFILMTDPDGTQFRTRMRYRDKMVASRVDPIRGRALDQTRVMEFEWREARTT